LPALRKQVGRPGIRDVVAVGVEDLGLEIPEQGIGLGPGAFAAERGVVVRKVLRQVDGAGPGAAGRGLEELVVARNEILAFVRPEKDRIRVFLGVPPLRGSLPDQLEENLGELADFRVVLDREIQDDDGAPRG
jgi:hypothetical protein